jgi:hypothetical protein
MKNFFVKVVVGMGILAVCPMLAGAQLVPTSGPVAGISPLVTATDRCIAHWSFDSSSGSTYYDVTGNGYNAVATGSGTGLAAGVKGQAINCSGSGFELTAINSSVDFNLTRYTIECWISCAAIPSVSATIFNNNYVQAYGGLANGYSLAVNADGNVVLCQSSSEGYSWVGAVSSAVLTPATWYHIACTYDFAAMKVYVNGVLSGSYSYQGTYPPSGADARIGCQKRDGDPNIYYPFYGKIDELKLYNYALSADTIAAHYNLTTAIKHPCQNLASVPSLKVQTDRTQLVVSLPPSLQGRSLDFAVYTASGKVMAKESVRGGVTSAVVPIHNLSTGAYVLVVNGGGRKDAVKFVMER